MEKITLSTQLVNALLQYLGQRPFVEVSNLISGIQSEASNQHSAPTVVTELPTEE